MTLKECIVVNVSSVTKSNPVSRLSGALAALGLVTLVGCGGGGGADEAPTISGLAAVGAAVPHAPVTARCASGPLVSGTTDGSGRFTLQLDGGQTLPCILRLSHGSPEQFLHSLAESEGRVNITPLTELVLARAAGQAPSTWYDDFDATRGGEVVAALPAAITHVGHQLQGVGLARPAIDPIRGSFEVGDAEDQILDALAQRLDDEGQTLEDLVTAAAQDEGDFGALIPAPQGGGSGGGGGAGEGAGDGGDSGGTPSSIFGRARTATDMALLQGLSGTLPRISGAAGSTCSYSVDQGVITVSDGTQTISAAFNGEQEDFGTVFTGPQIEFFASTGPVANRIASPGGAYVKLGITVSGGAVRLYQIQAMTNIEGTTSGMTCQPSSGPVSTGIAIDRITRSIGTLALMPTWTSDYVTLDSTVVPHFVGSYSGVASGGEYYRTCNLAAQGRGCVAANVPRTTCSMSVASDGRISLTVDGRSPSSTLGLIGQTMDSDVELSLTSPVDSSIQELVKGYKLNLPSGGRSSSDGHVRWADASFYEGPAVVSFIEVGPTGSGDQVEYHCTFRR